MSNARDPFAAVRAQAKDLVGHMTLEEKARLCGGMNFWNTTGVERLGLKPVMVTDGPHGLRKQTASADHLGINESVPSTCFPPACATACSFDPALMEEIGTAMGEECRQEEVAVILGPAANIKRSPLCGRNFEYFSEDPLLSGKTAAGLIRGVQSQNIGASLKHYLANNQEKARLASDSIIDERALREIYFRVFEVAIAVQKPSAVMTSYNAVNGIYPAENADVIQKLIRGEWGIDGMVMTDWGTYDTVDAVEMVKAGNCWLTEGSKKYSRLLEQAVKEGRLSRAVLERNVRSVISTMLKRV